MDQHAARVADKIMELKGFNDRSFGFKFKCEDLKNHIQNFKKRRKVAKLLECCFMEYSYFAIKCSMPTAKNSNLKLDFSGI